MLYAPLEYVGAPSRVILLFSTFVLLEIIPITVLTNSDIFISALVIFLVIDMLDKEPATSPVSSSA